jgi:mono/diheme cytochrome c family protein
MKKNLISIKLTVCVALLGLLLASCGKEDENSPGFEFMPDMYRSPSLEYYNVNILDGDTLMTAMNPVHGSIARGYMPYTIPNTPEGYEQSASLINPLPKEEMARWESDGEKIYNNMCVHCHGATGAGDGKVGSKLPGAPPAYAGQLKDLPAGKIYHSITYGKGLMGAHNSLVNDEERWKLVYYVQKLQGKGTAASAAATDSTSAKGGTATPAASGTATTETQKAQ